VKQESDFIEMGSTIGHELGHYLGLNHPSERRTVGSSQRYDFLTDTPQCSSRVSGGSYVLDARACILDVTNTLGGATCTSVCPGYLNGSNVFQTACPTQTACQFNHLMWWTTKNRNQTTSGVSAWNEDGSLISDQSSALFQWNPLVR
jgi:hypothetical protein